MNELVIDRKQEFNVLAQGVTENLYDDFIAFLDAKPKTIATYTRALRQFFIYIKDKGISHPTRETILLFREALISKNKPTTVQNYIVTVRLFFRWLEQQGLYKCCAPSILVH